MATDTSIEAYHSQDFAHVNKEARRILECLIEYGPQADFELAARLNRHPSQISARRGDLVNDQNTGKIIFTGRYTKNPHSGKTVRIWEANLTNQPTLL